MVPPTRVLDGFGVVRAAAADRTAGRRRATSAAPPRTIRPGFYGPPEGLLAVNTLAPADRLHADRLSRRSMPRIEHYRLGEPQDLRGPSSSPRSALLLIDALVVFWLAGGLYRLLPRRRRRAAALVAAPSASAPLAAVLRRRRARADAASRRLSPSKATIETRLAYVVTGDAEVDTISKAGLQGLTLFLAQRTALEAGEPVGLDLDARRARLLPADLLADRARARRSRRRRRWHASTPT